MGGIIPFVLQLLDALPGLINAGEEAAATIAAHRAALQAMVDEGRSPTQAEWDALNSQISGLQDQLDTPIAPAPEPVAAPVEAPAPEPVAAPVEQPAGEEPAPAA